MTRVGTVGHMAEIGDDAAAPRSNKASRLAANYQRGPDKQLKLIDDPATSN